MKKLALGALRRIQKPPAMVKPSFANKIVATLLNPLECVKHGAVDWQSSCLPVVGEVQFQMLKPPPTGALAASVERAVAAVMAASGPLPAGRPR